MKRMKNKKNSIKIKLNDTKCWEAKLTARNKMQDRFNGTKENASQIIGTNVMQNRFNGTNVVSKLSS